MGTFSDNLKKDFANRKKGFQNPGFEPASVSFCYGIKGDSNENTVFEAIMDSMKRRGVNVPSSIRNDKRYFRKMNSILFSNDQVNSAGAKEAVDRMVSEKLQGTFLFQDPKGGYAMLHIRFNPNQITFIDCGNAQVI